MRLKPRFIAFAMAGFFACAALAQEQEGVPIHLGKGTKGIHIPIGEEDIKVVPAFEDYAFMFFDACDARIGRATWRDIVGNTRKWKFEHRTQVLNMVDPERLKRAQEYAFENGMDIFDALDDIRRDEERHRYFRRKPERPALPPRRPGEEHNTRRYVHPPRLAPAEIAAGYLRHIPVGSKITGTRQYASI